MTTAKITKRDGYKCAPNGSIVEFFPFGAVVTGVVAEFALQDHAAHRMFDPREAAKVVAPDETKAKRAPRKKG